MACNQTSSASPTHPLSLIALIALIFLIALLNQLSTWVEVVKNQLISQTQAPPWYLCCLFLSETAFVTIRICFDYMLGRQRSHCVDKSSFMILSLMLHHLLIVALIALVHFLFKYFHLQIFGASPTTVFMYFLASAFSHQQTWLLPCTNYQPWHQSIRGCIFTG